MSATAATLTVGIPCVAQVYTINLESRYLMVQGVPAIGVMSELVQRCALYGVIEEYRPLDEYPAEAFTEVYLIKFQKLPAARFVIPAAGPYGGNVQAS